MTKKGSVAPKERVNIVYRPATGDAQQEIELPMRLLVLGDFTQAEDEHVVEEREVIDVDKDNFDDVLKARDVKLQVAVPAKLSESEGGEISVDLKFQRLKDFEPDQIVRQMPELAQLMELRDALKALKGPLGNVPSFRRKIQTLVSDPDARERLLAELGLDREEKSDD